MWRLLLPVVLISVAWNGPVSSPRATSGSQDVVASTSSKPAPATSCEGRPRLTSNGILLPLAVHRVEPDSSKCIGQEGNGNPVIEAVIGQDGQVSRVRSVSSSGAPACVVNAALDAVKRWRFCPAQRAGQRIEMTMQLTVHINYR